MYYLKLRYCFVKKEINMSSTDRIIRKETKNLHF